MASIARCQPQWRASIVIIQCDIDTRILQQQPNDGHKAPLTTKRKGRLSIAGLQIDINIWVCQKHFDNFNMTTKGRGVKRSPAVVVCVTDIVDSWIVLRIVTVEKVK